MREKAMSVLKKYNKSDALVKHALAVEGVMRHFAEEAGEDVEYWGAVGLLHDLDYEMYPEEHCRKSAEMLKEEGYDDEFIYSVISHGHEICVEAEPKKYMEKVLYAIDELTGLIAAAALMRPSKSVTDMKVKSVKKKFKDKNFAAGVDREIIRRGCERLDMELDEVIEKCIEGMREVHESIGL